MKCEACQAEMIEDTSADTYPNDLTGYWHPPGNCPLESLLIVKTIWMKINAAIRGAKERA